MADLASRGRLRRFPRGRTLLNEGERADRVALVRRGRVKISSLSDSGDEFLLAVRGPGDLLGEMSAIDGDPPSATVTALEPVEALIVPAAEFKAFLESNASIALHLLTMLSRRLRYADRKRFEFGAFDTLGRVASRLLELVEEFGEPHTLGTRISLPLTQRELAGWIGSSREAVSKALRALRGLGLIETGRGTIIVLDLPELRRRAS